MARAVDLLIAATAVAAALAERMDAAYRAAEPNSASGDDGAEIVKLP